jgi:hypothetical protein
LLARTVNLRRASGTISASTPKVHFDAGCLSGLLIPVS